MIYELDDEDLRLLKLVRKAVAYENRGDPAKDAINYDDMIEAMRLLLAILKAEKKGK